ncbi:unnamed protein product [Zymoseptoria tritici ST99CH_1A5]|uniref:Uncharacterized protein n=1 Tax=Zymoseptoria tritici ST99CH_1A5 TaxID=1276529 RepID=A0A1Y6LKQ1_ZYMTR|nr:unnamed protein product [Zymoseptoria tritici ST99CH_1A5]
MNTQGTYRPGDLTASGLLYEGSDFHSWAESTCALLRVRELMPAGFTFDALMAVDWATVDRRIPKQEEAMEVILGRVSPNVLQRIPVPFRFNTRELFLALQETSKPFRLMDLSPEFRNRVYQAALNDATPDQEISITKPRRSKLPPLLQMSRKVRVELRPLHFGTRTFKVEHIESDTDPVKTQLEEWMKQIVRSDAQHLRHLIIRLSLRRSHLYSSFRFTLRWSPTNGLKVTYAGAFKPDAKLRMKALEAKAFDMTKTMHLRGESIVLAMLVLDSLWTFRAVGQE